MPMRCSMKIQEGWGRIDLWKPRDFFSENSGEQNHNLVTQVNEYPGLPVQELRHLHPVTKHGILELIWCVILELSYYKQLVQLKTGVDHLIGSILPRAWLATPLKVEELLETLIQLKVSKEDIGLRRKKMVSASLCLCRSRLFQDRCFRVPPLPTHFYHSTDLVSPTLMIFHDCVHLLSNEHAALGEQTISVAVAPQAAIGWSLGCPWLPLVGHCDGRWQAMTQILNLSVDKLGHHLVVFGRGAEALNRVRSVFRQLAYRLYWVSLRALAS